MDRILCWLGSIPVSSHLIAMSSQQSPRRGTIEITLFGFLVSLTLKGALDTAYGHSVPTVTSALDLLYAVYVPASLLVIVFLLTLLRFVYGARRTVLPATASGTLQSHTGWKSPATTLAA
jgi:hypothetical protein